jgi:hypothetical protein
MTLSLREYFERRAVWFSMQAEAAGLPVRSKKWKMT